MKRYIAEAIGAFTLVFAGTGAVIVNDLHAGSITNLGIAITFGLVVLTMIYAIGDISGAHMNPAVTFAFWIAKRFPGKSVLPYIVSQCIGAILASVLLNATFTHSTLGATLPTDGTGAAIVMEIVLTFFLMFVILGVSTGAKEKGMMAGVAIGAVVCIGAMIGGPVCGASLNPARSIGPALVSGELKDLWIYLFAPTAGAVLAVFFYRFIQEVE